MKQSLRYFVPLLIAGALAIPACTTKNPNEPSVTFAAPLAAGPAGSTIFKFKAQPVTLTITNAVRASSTTATYNLEVATDAGLANKIVNQTGIAEGTGGTTSVTLTTLQGGTYYWRWHAVIDGVAGEASSIQSFVVQPQIILNSPTNAPANVGLTPGSATQSARPTFAVTNATHTGPVGPIFYLFQVSTSASFATITMSATVPEQANSTTTSWTPTSDLALGTYYWRAQASDPQDTETSAFTSTISFVRNNPFLDMTTATIINSPGDLASWAETATVTLIDTTQYVILDHDQRTGPGTWPDVPFGAGSLQYTLGMCANIVGHWYCSGVVQFWNGRELSAGGDVNQIGSNWFYGRWGQLNGYQPAQGEIVGLFAAAGNLRDNAGPFIAKERTKVVLIPWGSVYTPGQ